MALAVGSSDVLLTFAEIAVAFAGFSSVVAIFQKQSADRGAGFDLFRFWIMLEFSLAALFFALLPFPLHFLGLSAPVVWSCASGALLVFIVAHASFTSYLIRRGEPRVVSSLTRGLSRAAKTVYLVIVLAQALNLAGVPGRGFGLYLLGLFLLLFGAAVNFVRLVWVGNEPLTR